MKELIGLCERCKKNKATMQFSQSVTDFTHGFVENICQGCYDKIKHENTWYKEGRKELIEQFEKIIDECLVIDIKETQYLRVQDYNSNEFILKEQLKDKLKQLALNIGSESK